MEVWLGFLGENTMKKENYHLHTTISDGKLKPEELIKFCIKKNFSTICITDHYFFPKGFRDWGNDFYSEKDYNELKILKEKYKDKIKVLIGVEFDWLTGYENWLINESKKRTYDYKLISVHFLQINSEHCPIDYSRELFEEMIEKIGSAKSLVKKYYQNLKNAIKTNCFNIVAHLDLIKIWNKNEIFFSEKEDWYIQEIEEVLNLIKKYNMKIDVNLKLLNEFNKEQCPSLWIIKKAKKIGIELLVGTDGHKKNEIDYDIKIMKKLSLTSG